MNIRNDIVSGISRKFRREFGRAGGDEILKGANSCTISGISDCFGSIKPSVSKIRKSKRTATPQSL